MLAQFISTWTFCTPGEICYRSVTSTLLACAVIIQNREQILEMDSYIIRIYRRDADHLESVLGILEATSDGTQMSFQSRDELWKLLAEPPRQDKNTNKKSKLKGDR